MCACVHECACACVFLLREGDEERLNKIYDDLSKVDIQRGVVQGLLSCSAARRGFWRICTTRILQGSKVDIFIPDESLPNVVFFFPLRRTVERSWKWGGEKSGLGS